MSEKNVLRDRHLRDQVQLLINDGDAGREGIGGGIENLGFTADSKLAGGRGMKSAQRFEQG